MDIAQYVCKVKCVDLQRGVNTFWSSTEIA